MLFGLQEEETVFIKSKPHVFLRQLSSTFAFSNFPTDKKTINRETKRLFMASLSFLTDKKKPSPVDKEARMTQRNKKLPVNI